ncbi:Fur family transcriptional regulator [Paenibacillus thermotolerans]|uniref:Fur family transcriptional regulator n=1 Tax=Paenibacillus thermotolerans TaxID=3027807 RepID=UPI0023681AD5|nr:MULTISPECIES: Fur family transcriptional regulator [unclassified Paenibacillus]
MEAQEIIDAMSKKGLRVTDQRKTLACLFADAHGYLSAKDVYESMGKTYAGLSFDTVYRNLRLLHEMDVLEQFVFEDGVKFRARCGEHGHHHHAICLGCARTYAVPFCPMDVKVELPDGFDVVKHKFEIYGHCNECAGAKHENG